MSTTATGAAPRNGDPDYTTGKHSMLTVNDVGEPYAGKLHAGFDREGLETGKDLTMAAMLKPTRETAARLRPMRSSPRRPFTQPHPAPAQPPRARGVSGEAAAMSTRP